MRFYCPFLGRQWACGLARESSERRIRVCRQALSLLLCKIINMTASSSRCGFTKWAATAARYLCGSNWVGIHCAATRRQCPPWILSVFLEGIAGLGVHQVDQHVVGLWDRAILSTLACAACRAGAVAKLRLQDFQHDSEQYTLPFHKKGPQEPGNTCASGTAAGYTGLLRGYGHRGGCQGPAAGPPHSRDQGVWTI